MAFRLPECRGHPEWRYESAHASPGGRVACARTGFAARRLIRNAFAVRERLGDPRVVPGFHCSFLPGMPPSPTPGESDIDIQKFDADIAFAE